MGFLEAWVSNKKRYLCLFVQYVVLVFCRGPHLFFFVFFLMLLFYFIFFLSFLASILPFDSPFILNHISNLDEVIQQESSTWAMAKEVLAVCLIFFFMGFLVLVNLAKKTYLNIN